MAERIRARKTDRSDVELTARGPEHYEAILQSIGEAVHSVDSQGRITFANLPAASMLGWSEDDLIGQSQHALLHHTRADGKPYPESECPILAALREGRAHRQDGDTFWKKDGTSLPVDYIVTPLREHGTVVGAVVAFRDATERRHTARRLAYEQAARSEGERLSRELQRVFMQIPAAICTTRGPDHIIETANPLYQQLVGRSDLVGKSKREVFLESGDEVEDLLDRVYATGQSHAGNEVRRVWDRGTGAAEEGFVNFVYEPLRDISGAVYGVVCLIVDVTELVRSRRLVEVHADELKHATESLSRINRELDQFAYVASHDLKAPLRGIASLATWIEEDLGAKLGSESRQHLTLLRSRIRRMEALIDGLLQYSRAGRVRNRVETVNVRELLNEVVEMLDPGPDVSIDIAPAMPTIETERVPLQQVFLNLIGNALKHSGRLDTHVTVNVKDASDFFEFIVDDNGSGIPRAFHSKIWDIFQTLQPRDKVEGAGIGLALVKKNVESRGGTVSVDAAESGGARFSFLWPKHLEQEG